MTPTATPADTRPCPHCGQPIKSGALVCRHCQRDLFAGADAPPIVGQHDWEREQPPEKVVYTVRLPVSERQWALMCYGLAILLGFFWIGEALRPPPLSPESIAARAAQARPLAPILSHSLVEQATPEPESSGAPHTLVADAGPAHAVSLGTLTEREPVAPAGTPAPESIPGSSAPSSGDSSPSLPSFSKGASRAAVDDASSGVGSGDLIGAADLVDAYDNHMDVAEDKFTHKPLIVAGTVISTGKLPDKTPFVLLRGTTDTHIRCLFTSLKGKAGPSLAAGAEVHISGTCEGRYVDVMLSDCEIAP